MLNSESPFGEHEPSPNDVFIAKGNLLIEDIYSLDGLEGATATQADADMARQLLRLSSLLNR